MRERAQTTRVDAIVAAVHALDEARAELDELRARHSRELSKAEAKIRIALERVERRAQDPVADPGNPFLDYAREEESAEPPAVDLGDDSVSICWRLAFALLANPVLDYFATAEAIWGPGLGRKVASNRVNAQLTRLKKLEVAIPKGGKRYAIDRRRLADLSGLPVPGVAPELPGPQAVRRGFAEGVVVK